LAMTRVDALNAAGKLALGGGLYSGSLDDALWRLQYPHEQLELLQPYFPKGWEAGPVLLPEFARTNALVITGRALRHSGQAGMAIVLYIHAIKDQLAHGTVPVLLLGNLVLALQDETQRACADRILSLAIRLVDRNDKDLVLRLDCFLALAHIHCNRLGDA